MIGITTSCSLNLKIAFGSDSKTEVSSTYVLVAWLAPFEVDRDVAFEAPVAFATQAPLFQLVPKLRLMTFRLRFRHARSRGCYTSVYSRLRRRSAGAAAQSHGWRARNRPFGNPATGPPRNRARNLNSATGESPRVSVLPRF